MDLVPAVGHALEVAGGRCGQRDREAASSSPNEPRDSEHGFPHFGVRNRCGHEGKC